MKKQELAARIDHTLLKPEATDGQVRKMVAQAVQYRFASVCVNPRWVPLVRELLDQAAVSTASADNLAVATCGCIGFPLGATFSRSKAAEAQECVKQGAGELDMVIFLPALLECNLAAAKDDIQCVVNAAREIAASTVVKVILETAVLNESQIAVGCEAAYLAGADFVKTSTGFHPAGGATVQVVRRLKAYSRGLKVKASGGIRDLRTATAMLDAGADRLGCSAGVEIIGALPD